MLRSGAAALFSARTEINDLNVFPIPDGDTGDNMYMTISSGFSAADRTVADGATASFSAGTTLADVARRASSGMLLGARGNSGVILSRIFAGLSRGLDGLDRASVPDFVVALHCAVEDAYASVTKPVEGTVLTVLREGVENSSGDDFISLFKSLCENMRVSLEHTPDLLPVLKDSGVVDSGGAGLLKIFCGMFAALVGDDSFLQSAPGQIVQSSATETNLDAFGPDSELEFGYCTEFLLRLQNSKVDTETFDEVVIRDWLVSVGESVVCFREGSIVKVHVHTRTPGEILNHCQIWGEFLSVKIENMTLQHLETTISPGTDSHPGTDSLPETVSRPGTDSHPGTGGISEAEIVSSGLGVKRPRRKSAVVAVANGDGLVQMFRELGAEEVIEGGQTMNPSVDAFISAFDRVNAERIFVLPNNSNIVLTARQAAAMYSESEVTVIESKNPGAGIVVLGAVDFFSPGPDTTAEADAVASSVVCAMVSRAIRDTAGVRKGEYVGIHAGEIVCSSSDLADTLNRLASELDAVSSDVIVLISGSGVSDSEAGEISAAFQKKYPRTEVISRKGGQAVYDYILIIQ